MHFLTSSTTLSVAYLVVWMTLIRKSLVSHNRKARNGREEVLKKAVGKLKSRPSLDELVTCWGVIPTDTRELRFDNSDVNAVAACLEVIDLSGEENVKKQIQVLARSVRAISDFAAYLDDGLIRGVDIAKSYPEVHQELLYEISVIAPLIWYESTVGGRGRWGFRALRLFEILKPLRAISPKQSLLQPQGYSIGQITLLNLPSVSWRSRVVMRVWVHVHFAKINSRSKVKQNDFSRDLFSLLQGKGIGTPHRDIRESAVYW